MKEILEKLYCGETLDFEESRQLICHFMKGEEPDAVIAAALVALKVRGETPEEIAGAARALQEAALPVRSSQRPLIDTCGTGGDGFHSINLSTAAALVLAASGLAVAKHGNRAVSSKSGSADVLEALGVKLDLEPASNESLLEECGICFLFAPRYHRAMKHVMPARQALSSRTLFNLIGPLSNPARPTHQILGVYREDLIKPMALALRELGLERACVVHGSGMDELALHGPSKLLWLEDGAFREEELDPRELGISPAEPEALRGGDAEENAGILRELLAGDRKGPMQDAVALNAAAGMILAGLFSSWAEALEGAREILASGQALKTLEDWATASEALP
ncbi:MAG: anthranilate phosphoribosyltransferase [Candidatus Krumholzibacteria bacterium]|jgi:anthranilate phosphoribosyltransferase|nr:anthranilate phosphoribosyltransferase [Candidatus Krumholzibacteria bacterium]MDP7021804.1 anthranilate phosphoribosyltransferase [Candidatus Krumholzibacteria bacterium]